MDNRAVSRGDNAQDNSTKELSKQHSYQAQRGASSCEGGQVRDFATRQYQLSEKHEQGATWKRLAPENKMGKKGHNHPVLEGTKQGPHDYKANLRYRKRQQSMETESLSEEIEETEPLRKRSKEASESGSQSSSSSGSPERLQQLRFEHTRFIPSEGQPLDLLQTRSEERPTMGQLRLKPKEQAWYEKRERERKVQNERQWAEYVSRFAAPSETNLLSERQSASGEPVSRVDPLSIAPRNADWYEPPSSSASKDFQHASSPHEYQDQAGPSDQAQGQKKQPNAHAFRLLKGAENVQAYLKNRMTDFERDLAYSGIKKGLKTPETIEASSRYHRLIRRFDIINKHYYDTEENFEKFWQKYVKNSKGGRLKKDPKAEVSDYET